MCQFVVKISAKSVTWIEQRSAESSRRLDAMPPKVLAIEKNERRLPREIL
jgi:hypothetical protein